MQIVPDFVVERLNPKEDIYSHVSRQTLYVGRHTHTQRDLSKSKKVNKEHRS